MAKRATFIVMAALALAPLPGALLAQGAAPVGGTISIEPGNAEETDDASFRSFASAVSAALTERGFTILNDANHAAYVASLSVDRTQVGTAKARVPGQRAVSVGGGGIGIPFSTGASDVVPLRRTRLAIRIRRRGGTADVWTGAAITVREATGRNGADDAVATDLARALVGSYPAKLEDPIGVP